jgi:RNA polymerase sigma factor (sigma-70 family)
LDINNLHKKACLDDNRAKEKLFEVLSSRFRLFANHQIQDQVDAEEIVQEALMTIYSQFDKIEFHTSFSAWACKVLDNRLLNYYQKKKRENKKLNREIGDNQDLHDKRTDTNPDLKRKLLDCFRRVCKRNMRYARILNLHYQGYKTEEISSRMSMKPATLYSGLSKARAMLEQCLQNGDESE